MDQAKFLDKTVPHYERNPLDRKHPGGGMRVRIDGGDSKTPIEERLYSTVRAGYGAGERVRRALRLASRGARWLGSWRDVGRLMGQEGATT